MDRGIIYPGQVPLETDLLFAQRASMLGLSKLAAAILGTGTLVNGLAVTQTTVASMNVQVGAGEIYQLASLDATAYSSLAADTTHQVVKQGVNLDATLLALTAPGTVGFSINYLIQATLTEADNTSVVLPYFNASNPSTAYSGPAGAGTAQNTRRSAVATLSAKAGTAATTGSQTTPSPDAGCVGLAVVTVANGAVSITNSNIGAYSGTPSLPPGGLATGGLALLGSYTSGSGNFIVPAGKYRLFYRVWGGGGGGGSGSAAAQSGNGGGAGGYCEGWLSVAPGQSIAYAVGASGAQGSGGAGGSNGGSSSLNGSIVASGGAGGAGGGTGGGSGGTASGGDVALVGGSGTGPSISNSAGTLYYAPPGGASYGAGPSVVGYGTSIGTAGKFPGGGGAGGVGGSSGAQQGGAGATGAIYIWG